MTWTPWTTRGPGRCPGRSVSLPEDTGFLPGQRLLQRYFNDTHALEARQIVDQMDALYTSGLAAPDIRGDVYERLLSKLSTAGMSTGYDMDRTMLRIGAMNMMTHGVEDSAIQYKDSLSDQNADVDKYTMILTNLSFKGKTRTLWPPAC